MRHRDFNHGGVYYWSEFVPSRGIAMHKYAPVDGTALSHGCVRLKHDVARKIFCNVRQNRTMVKVSNPARPKCNNSNLQTEWMREFQGAARPLDGEALDPARRRAIRESRRIVRESLGTLPTSAELSAMTAADIPRCRVQNDREEARLDAGSGLTGSDIASGSRELRLAARFQRTYPATRSRRHAENLIRQQAARLWRRARTDVQSNSTTKEDRELYWARLSMARAIRQRPPRWFRRLAPAQQTTAQAELLALLELTSCGMSDISFGTDPAEKRILVTGFDPFGLESNIRQANPSGAAVLDLDGTTLTAGTDTARVEGAIFPVRFADFNQGIVENFMRPQLSSANPPHLIMTISQGGSDFELERYAGRRRSSDPFRDNQDLLANGDDSSPVVAPGMPAGDEFVETTMNARLRSALASGPTGAGADAIPVRVDSMVTSRRAGQNSRVRGSQAIRQNATAVRGSGGGFLSNEIFYRTLLAVNAASSTIPMIHLHTPAVDFGTGPDRTPAAMNTMRTRIVSGVREILLRALPTI